MAVLLLSMLASNSYAASGLYKIELLVFSQDMPNTEVFDQTNSLIAWPKHVVDRISYQQVGREQMNLLGSYSRLSRGQNYRVLMHVAWTQSVKANRLGTAVRIANPEGTINGFFRLQRGHLVHMIADIEYAPDPYQGAVMYRLNEKRRFKLNETHYLDHPRFGILARISPL